MAVQEVSSSRKSSSLFNLLSIVAVALCVLFMVATVVLGLKLRNLIQKEELEYYNKIHYSSTDSDGTHEWENLAQSTTTENSLEDIIPTGDPGPLSVADNWQQSAEMDRNSSRQKQLDWPKPSGSLLAEYRRAAIASDHGLCSEIGRDVMLEGGNAVDAMIASFLCIGVVNPQSSGLGGGFFMTIYNASSQRCYAIDAREMAPLSENATMYAQQPRDSSIGYRSVAVPGELHGYWTAFTRFGSGQLAWKRLFEPAIKLARHGFPVSSHLAMVIRQKVDELSEDKELRHVFIDNRTGQPFEEGDVVRREKLAHFMEQLASAKNPLKLFYNGDIAKGISAEFKLNGGHVSVDDLRRYRSIVHEKPLQSELQISHQQLTMCGPPPPSSFAIAQTIIRVMAEFYGNNQTKLINLDDPLIYHRLIEVQKFAYAQRTKLADAAFVTKAGLIGQNMTEDSFIKWIASLVPEQAKPLDYYSLDLTGHVPDHGTSHVVAIDREGNAISATSSINQLLGSRRMSPTLGIIWNDSMDDFSSPNTSNAYGFSPSPENFIEPRKRPMSSMSPMIIYDKNTGKVRMAVGGSGGSRIISAVAQTVIRALIFNQTIKEAVDAPRFHNQFLPHVTEFEQTVPEQIIKHLIKERRQNMTSVEKQVSIVQALLATDDGFIHGNSDFRRKTSAYPSGF